MAKKKSVKQDERAQAPAAVPAHSSLPMPGWMKKFLVAVLVLAGLFLLGSLVQNAGRAESIRILSAQEGWGGLAGSIVDHKVQALLHGAVMLAAAGAALWVLWTGRVASPRGRALVGAALLGLVVFDAWLLSRHYVQPMSLDALRENEVIRLLKQSSPERRVALVSQDGHYNFWLTYVFPYHRIKTVNITQMPRMPEDYKKFLSQVGRNVFRFWELSGVEYVLGPAGLWGQIQNDPGMRGSFELAYAYSVIETSPGVPGIVPSTRERPGQHVVLRLVRPAPRYALVNGWEQADDETALARLAAASFTPFSKVLVAPESAAGLKPMDGEGLGGSLAVESYRTGQVQLKVNAAQPAILRFAEKYDTDWKAWVDGVETKVLRVDFIYQGVAVEPGIHTVEFRYAPPGGTIWLQILALLVSVGAGAVVLFRRPKPVEAVPAAA